MSAPSSEPGWEIIYGPDAQKVWGPKDRSTMQIWITDFWVQPDESNYYCATWYRRPLPAKPEQEHFI